MMNDQHDMLRSTSGSSTNDIVVLATKDEEATNPFEQQYQLEQRLRSGSYGTVYTCRRWRRGEKPNRPTIAQQEQQGRRHGNNNNGATSEEEEDLMEIDDETTVTTRTQPDSQHQQEDVQQEEDDSSQELYAVKILDRRRLSSLKKRRRDGTTSPQQEDDNDSHILREVTILQQLRNVPHVVHLHDFFQTSQHLYLVLTYAAGGDVLDRLASKTTYDECQARNVARILLTTLDHLHARNMVHRDLKPDNLLLQTVDDDCSILLADFGFARQIHPPHDLCRTLCGTPAFVAPEIILGCPYGTSCDVWSAGCVMYMLLSGRSAFTAPNHRALFRKVRAGDYVFYQTLFDSVSVSAKRFVSRLLTVNVDKRWTAQQALQSDWFTTSDAALKRHDLSNSLTEIKRFQAGRKWRSTTSALRWASTAPFWTVDRITFHQQLQQWDRQDQERATQAQQHAPAMQRYEGPLLQQSAPLMGKVTDSMLAKLPLVKFDQIYARLRPIREGSYASVWECRHVATGDVFAVKIVERKQLHPHDDEAVLNEVAILQALCDDKYIVQLLDFYEEDDAFYLVMEYMHGGDVFDRIVSLTQYTEADARHLILILLKAVKRLHQAGICHRDLKPQNLLLKYADDPSQIKLADFGFARRVHTPQSLTTRVGTPTYVAPEILKNVPHDERVDLWSIGVIAYVLLVGYPPFMEEDQQALFQKIRTGDYIFYEPDWNHISLEAQEFIQGLLKVDPLERWTIDEALRSSWIHEPFGRLSSIHLTESLRVLKEKKLSLRFLARAFMWTGGGSSNNSNTDNTSDATTSSTPPLELREVLTSAQDKVVSSAQDTASTVLQVVTDAHEVASTVIQKVFPPR